MEPGDETIIPLYLNDAYLGYYKIVFDTIDIIKLKKYKRRIKFYARNK